MLNKSLVLEKNFFLVLGIERSKEQGTLLNSIENQFSVKIVTE